MCELNNSLCIRTWQNKDVNSRDDRPTFMKFFDWSRHKSWTESCFNIKTYLGPYTYYLLDFEFDFVIKIIKSDHSMAMGNLNKSKEANPAIGSLSKIIKITPFGPHFIKFSKTVFIIKSPLISGN